MTRDTNNVLVFKTNISTKTDALIVKDMFNAQAAITDWSIDTEDDDCVLRVVSKELSAGQIIELIQQKGYQCLELV